MKLQTLSFDQRLQFWLQFAVQMPTITVSHPLLIVRCPDFISADRLLQQRSLLKRMWTGEGYDEQPTVLELWAKGRRYDRISL